MGYDMFYSKPDPAEQAEVEQAQEVFDAACKARDAHPHGSAEAAAAQEKVHVAYKGLLAAEKSYFRLNIFGMGRYRDIMVHTGMAFEDSTYPGFPPGANYGLTREQSWAAIYPEEYPDVYEAMADSVRAAGAKFAARWAGVLAWHGTERPGIPLHKFSSNDAWHVLPAECEAAVRLWHQFVQDKGEDEALAYITSTDGEVDYWLKWIEYLAGAARHGGFLVR